MRVSVMLHLPALVITRQIDKVFRSLQKISLAVRGLYGEGSQAMGDFYQISNQITLGRSEEELIKQVGDIVPVIIDYERQAREFLVKREPREPARPRQPGLRHSPHRADDQLRRDDAPALERADGRESGPDPRPGDPDGQRAVHPHAAGPSAEAHRRGARHGRPQHRAGRLSPPPPQQRPARDRTTISHCPLKLWPRRLLRLQRRGLVRSLRHALSRSTSLRASLPPGAIFDFCLHGHTRHIGGGDWVAAAGRRDERRPVTAASSLRLKLMATWIVPFGLTIGVSFTTVPTCW